MAIELFNPRFNDYDEIEVEFVVFGGETKERSQEVASGNIVVELDPREDGRYFADLTLVSPTEGYVGVVNYSREQNINILEDRKRLATCVRLLLRDAERRTKIEGRKTD